MTPQQYHADRTHLSRSMLFELYQSPRVYEARYITRSMPPKSVTEAMMLGTAIHAEVLLGESVVRTCPQELLSSDGAMRTNAAKEWKENAIASGFAVLGKESRAKIAPTVESIRRTLHRAGIDLAKCVCETPVRWEEGGVKCKAMPDILAGDTIIDLKTQDDVTDRAIVNKIRTFGYWLQHVHYCAGTAANDFWFVFAETQPPWRCKLRRIPAWYLDWARQKRAELLADFARRQSENDWADPDEGIIKDLDMPVWDTMSNEDEEMKV